jgi:hypothetical protein
MARHGAVFDWDDTLFRRGVYASCAWVTCVAIFLWAFADWSHKPRPNEWGDIFAGVAAPIAFLWLVLGFLQQGRELKLQVQELRNTVKHQADLAEATREQVALQIRQEEQAGLQRQIAALPRFVLSSTGSSGGPNGIEYDIELTNGGAIATNVHVSFDPTPQTGGENFIPTIGPRDQPNFRVRYPNGPPNGLTALIKFTDATGVDGRQLFNGTAEGSRVQFIKSAL